jgi:ADP-heptose:LPS heptosyltransferase
LRYDRIGDMVISTPVFRELKRLHPHLKILVLASKINNEVLNDNPYVDEVFINYKNNFFGDIFSLLKLRKRRLDVCVEFDHSVVLHAILRLRIINPKKIISVAKDGRYGVTGDELLMYDYYTKKPKDIHFRDIWLKTLQPFGIEPISNKYDLFCSDEQEEVAINYLKKYRSKYKIGINLEGAVKGKKIRFSELYQICQGLYEQNNNILIVILTTPKNFQSVKEKLIKMELDYVVVSYKTDTILDVAAVINQLDLMITPDTSISHIASAFNKPIVTIHENNQDSYQLFAPTSNLNRTVFSKSKNSLNGFSLSLLLSYCFELINLKKKTDYE